MKLTGIRFRLLLLGIIPAFILTSALAYYFIANQIQNLEISLNERGDIITRQLAFAGVYGVFSRNHTILQELVNPILQEKDVVSVQIFNIKDEILAESHLSKFPEPKYLLNFTAPVVLKTVDNSNSIDDTLFYPGVEKPIGKTIGTVRIRLSLKNTLASQQTVLINSLLITFIGVLITALLAFRIGHRISLPIIKLTQTVNDISMGNLSIRANFKADHEIEDLREGFNVMAIGLEQTHHYLENQIEKATRKHVKANIELERKNQSLEKTKQLAVAQNEIKSQFLAHISHEIRTPMNGIIGFTDLLLNSNQDSQQIDRLELIRSSATNLLSIVNEILELSSLESGKFSLNYNLFNLHSCLENAVSLFSTNTKKIELVLDIDSRIPQQINNDSIRLQQIITNLLSNALKFTHHGHVIIRCRLLNSHSDQNTIFISISDTGIGISKTDQARLFSPFLQLSQFAINKEQGTGLGLSICKNIVERMHGKIGVFSSKNIGSTFWLKIPCSTCQSYQPQTDGSNIIIIMASTINRHAFKKQLLNLGHRVIDYVSIATFLASNNKKIDLIFIDAALSIEHNSSASNQNQFDLINKQNPKVIFLNRHDKIPLLPPGAITLDLPCRSNYLSSLIKLNSINDTNPKVDQKQSTLKKPKGNAAILIADDNEINRILLKSQFEELYQHIHLAKDGREALNFISTSTYDLIILDLQMPGLTGMALIKKIKTPQCRNFNTPIIAITAHAQIDQRQKVIDAGFDDCLIKPVLPADFAKVIDTFMHQNTQPSLVIADHQQDFSYVQIMLSRTKNDKALAQNLFETLFQELPVQIQEIKSACAEFDFSLAQEITHKLHGSVSFCGFIDIKHAARDLEITLTTNETKNLSRHLEQLEKHITRFMSEKNIILDEFRA